MTIEALNALRDGAGNAQISIGHARTLGRAISLALSTIERWGDAHELFAAVKGDMRTLRGLVDIQADQLADAMKQAEAAGQAEVELRLALHPPQHLKAA